MKTMRINLSYERRMAIGKRNLLLMAAQQGSLTKSAAKKAGLSALNRKAKNENTILTSVLKTLVGKRIELGEFQRIVTGEKPPVNKNKVDLRTLGGRLVQRVKTLANGIAAKRLYRLITKIRHMSNGWNMPRFLKKALEEINNRGGFDKLFWELLNLINKAGLGLCPRKPKSQNQIAKAEADAVLMDKIELNKFKLSLAGLSL